MRIGILGTRGIPNQYGGFEQFTEMLSQGLVKRGHEVYVYCSSNHPYQQSKWMDVNLIHIKDKENKIGTAGQFMYDLRSNRDAAKRNFDVLFHFGYSSDALWWRSWPKNAINIVNMDGLEWKRTKYNTFTRRFLKLSEKWAAFHAGALVADSVAIKDHIRKSYNKTAVVIPYGASVFAETDPSVLSAFGLLTGNYFMAIARMEPENHIEMIIKGWFQSGSPKPLLVIGGTTNKHGKYLVNKYKHEQVRFIGPLYDFRVLNNLRAFSSVYFHGHSVGGTNPSLLEAMACGCTIAAHDNVFNRAVLGNEADYFSDPADVAELINVKRDLVLSEYNRLKNFDKIRKCYDPDKIISAYEELAIRLLAG
jgi:glycosyltransferase involved in cell wall biosynthesis